MNVLDLVLLVVALSAIVGGFRWGLLTRGFSWLGLAAGVLLAAWVVPLALDVVATSGALVRLLVGVAALVLTVSVASAIGRAVGLNLRRMIAAGSLRPVDQALGAVAGALSVALVVWFLLPAAAEIPGMLSRQVRNSAIVSTIRDVAPPPPDTVRALRQFVDSSRFPEVFADLQPTPVTGPPPAQIPVPASVIERVTAATVNVESIGCGRRYEGSGFAIATDTIVTNAHVVAGSDSVEVRRPDGELLDARVVKFDDDRDLAVLAVPGLGQQPLSLQQAEVGEPAAVIGYPGGQDQPRTAPARVSDERVAVGRDIYGQDRTRRRVLFLSATLRQGDSGSPTIDADGNVIGAVFAISPDQPTTAFALDVDEIEALLDAPRDPGSGRCI